MTTLQPRESAQLVEPSMDSVRSRLIELLESIPFEEDGDGSGIAADILNAESWEDYKGDTAARPKASAVANRRLRVRELYRRDSDIDNPDESGLNLPWYVVAVSTDIENGAEVVWQTSAVTPLTKLLQLHAMGKLPAIVETKLSGKKTKRGFTPVNMVVHSVTD